MPTKVEGSENREVLTVEELEAMMQPGERVHTFRNAGGVLFGCDMERVTIIEMVRNGATAELAGETATAMNHGIVIMSPTDRPLFVETKATP